MVTAYESIYYLAGAERDSGDVVLSKRDCVEMAALVEALKADARTLWAVRVLDAWADSRGVLTPAPYPLDKHSFVVGFEGERYYGATREAARDAAAQAVYPTLDADVRAKIGERP
jgi:hypothetical protein